MPFLKDNQFKLFIPPLHLGRNEIPPWFAAPTVIFFHSLSTRRARRTRHPQFTDQRVEWRIAYSRAGDANSDISKSHRDLKASARAKLFALSNFSSKQLNLKRILEILTINNIISNSVLLIDCSPRNGTTPLLPCSSVGIQSSS